MINNWTSGLIMVLGASACRANATVPPGFQGVIEYDARIVGFEQPGRVERVAAVRGGVIEPGGELVKLDDVLARLELDARRAEADAARADLALLQSGSRPEEIAAQAAQTSAAAATAELSRKAAARVRVLREGAVLPESESDKAEADLARTTFEHIAMQERLVSLKRGARPQEVERARAQVARSASAVALAAQRLERQTLRAAEGGEVLDVHVKMGEVAMTGAPAVTIADTGHPYVDIFIPQGKLSGVRVGASATLRTDSEPDAFVGVVERVASETEFTPKFIFSEAERPNLVVRVRVRVTDRDHRLHAGAPAFVEVRP